MGIPVSEVLQATSLFNMRAFAFFAVLLITASGGQLASALLPPFAVAAVEAMWARRMATSSTPAPFRMGNGSKSTAGKPSPPPPTSHTKATTRAEPEIPELMLRDILPQGGSRNDRSVQKNLMETLMEGKMILRGDTMKDEGMQDYIAKIVGEKSFIFF